MNLIYRLLGYSKYNKTHTNAAVLIQQRYQDFRKQQQEERENLIKSINNTFNTTEYTVIAGIKDGNPIVFKESIDEPSDDEFSDEMNYYLNERKRVKNISPKEHNIQTVK